MTDLSYPRALSCGDGALTIEFGDQIDESLNARVLDLDARLATEKPIGVIETIPTYRSLFVSYDPVRTGFAALSQWLLAQAATVSGTSRDGRKWRIPVNYGGDSGIDLGFVAEKTGLSEAEVVRRHTGVFYRVYMMGFMPGFTYLGGLDPTLAVARRNDPRLTSPAGTISIGGVQTGIQCLVSPTGWHLIGRTPVRTYDPHRSAMFFLEPGDSVSFFGVDAEGFAALERRAEAGELLAEDVSAMVATS